MATGRQPGLIIRQKCAATGELLVGGAFSLIDENGNDYSAALDKSGYLAATYYDSNGHVHDVPFGVYQVVVEKAGHLADSEVETHSLLDETLSITFDDNSAGYIDIMLPLLPKTDISEEKSDKSVSTKAEKQADKHKIMLYGGYLAAILALIILGIIIIIPVVYMTVAGLGLGFQKGAQLFMWYLQNGFLFCGVGAVWLMISQAGLNIVACILSLVAAGAFWFFSFKKTALIIEEKILVKDEMLDRLPKPADDATHGSGKLIRSMEMIRQNLPTYDPASNSKLEKPGIFVGFVDAPLYKAAPAWALSQIQRYFWKLKCIKINNQNNKMGIFEKRLPLPAEPAKFKALKQYVFLDEFLNTILLGDTRAGKTRRILLATIDLLTRGKQSILIIDPKGELNALMHPLCAERYGESNVNVINFRGGKGNRWNPMQDIVDAANSERGGVFRRDTYGRVLGNYSQMESTAADFVKMLIPEENDVGTAKYFNDGARSIIKSVAIYVASNLSGCPDDQKSPATVAMLIDLYVRPQEKKGKQPKHGNKTDDKWSPYRKMLELLPHNHPCRQAFSTANAANDKELGQFCTTALTALQDYRDDNIAKLTATTDIPLAKLGRVPSVTFLVIPHEKETYAALARLYIQQSYAALIGEATRTGGKLPVPVTFLCEELGQIPPIPNLDGKLTVSLGSGIRWVLVFQSLAQVVEKYEKAATDVIWGNCDYKILLKTTDTSTTGKAIQDILGVYTCKETRTSKSRGVMSFIPNGLTDMDSLIEREVLKASEVAQWHADIGALVMNSREKGHYVVPLPDVSQTPTGELIHINDADYIAQQYRETYALDASNFVDTETWNPAYGQMKPGHSYTDEEYATAHSEFLNSLLEKRILQDKNQKLLVGFVSRSEKDEKGEYLSQIEEVSHNEYERKQQLEELRQKYPPEKWIEIGERRDKNNNDKLVGWFSEQELKNTVNQKKKSNKDKEKQKKQQKEKVVEFKNGNEQNRTQKSI